MREGDTAQATVLLVDDDEEDLFIAEAALDTLDVIIRRAKSGEEALAILRDLGAAVVVLDVRMPGMNGYETARLIHEDELSRITPIIFLTGVGEESDFIAGYSLGAVDFIVKPVKPVVLRSKVGVFVDLYRASKEVERQAVLLVEAERLQAEADRRVQDLVLQQREVEADRQHREELELTNAELRAVNARLASAQQHLQVMMRDKDRLIATVSHEMRTPLAGVLGFAMELRDGLAGFTAAEVTEFASLIAQGCATAAGLVDDLLVAARIETGIVAVTPEPTNLHSLVGTVISSVEVAVPSGVKSLSVSGGAAIAWADPRRVSQILRNLLVNAVRYGGDNIQVVVGTRDADDQVVLEVIDDGAGVLRKGLLFEPYQHGAQVPGRTESVGLGLYVSRSLARLMGGDLTYRREGGLSVFELSLPGQAPTPH
jgi:signal transduction histidine kinase